MRNRILLLAMAVGSASAMSVSFTPSVKSPAPLGTLVTFAATAGAPDPGTLVYRFRLRDTGLVAGRIAAGPQFRTVVDYGPRSTLDWTTIHREGTYVIEASVKNTATGEVANASTPFVFTKLAGGAQPVVTATAN